LKREVTETSSSGKEIPLWGTPPGTKSALLRSPGIHAGICLQQLSEIVKTKEGQRKSLLAGKARAAPEEEPRGKSSQKSQNSFPPTLQTLSDRKKERSSQRETRYKIRGEDLVASGVKKTPLANLTLV